jgi:hypothetical protein
MLEEASTAADKDMCHEHQRAGLEYSHEQQYSLHRTGLPSWMHWICRMRRCRFAAGIRTVPAAVML